MQAELQPLLNAVQRNCHISDARHAGDYTLCVYLLKMREYFRWEKGYRYRDSLPEGDLGDWIKERELFWQSIEDESFADLPIYGDLYDPFDNAAINDALYRHGLVYSGGLGHRSTPHFFLGKLDRAEKQTDLTILMSNDEYARDMTAPPAMAREGTIFVRRESVRRMIWEKIEEWRWNRLDNAMGRALACFDFESAAESALEAMTDSVIDIVLMHEKGEVMAGKRLGPGWEQMLASLPHSQAELMVRAVRDHLADSMTTLPSLVRDGRDASLHFYFANLGNMRKHLFPSLARAYDHWSARGRRDAIEELLSQSKSHWSMLACRMLALYRDAPDDFADRLQSMVEDNRL
jgi:hypothetical protein